MEKLIYGKFTATVEYSEDDKVFVGRIDDIKSVISFEGGDVLELTHAFKEAVGYYIDFCKRKGINPHG